MSTKNPDSQPIVGSPAPGAPTTSTVNAPALPPKGRTDATASVAPSEKPAKTSSKVGATWVFLFLGMLLLILLLAFVLQNLNQVSMTLFTWQMSFPLGVGMLLAAIAGALIMALIGSVRIIQLRRQVARSTHKGTPSS